MVASTSMTVGACVPTGGSYLSSTGSTHGTGSRNKLLTSRPNPSNLLPPAKSLLIKGPCPPKHITSWGPCIQIQQPVKDISPSNGNKKSVQMSFKCLL